MDGTVEEERDDDEGIYYEPCSEKDVNWLAEMISTHKTLQMIRSEILNRHFGEICIPVLLKEQEKQLLINEHVNREFTYLNVFLGSSIGFNKNNWNRNIEKLLEPFGLKQKPLFGTRENCFLFEKLKYLVLKYMERVRK